jgi:hypothetical protein
MSGVGKTTAARELAHRCDLRLYSLDSRTYAHASLLPTETRTLDELWVDTTPDTLADWFEEHARRRFALVLGDLAEIDDDAPVLVDGPQLLPELVAAHLASADWAVYVIARPELQQMLVKARGSDLPARTRDPERATANRLGRDAELARRLRASAAQHGLPLVEVHEIEETLPAVEMRLLPLIAPWLAKPHGDVGDRRRDENDARLRQLRAHADATGIEPVRDLELACECNAPGCTFTVTAGLIEAETARERAEPFLSPLH